MGCRDLLSFFLGSFFSVVAQVPSLPLLFISVFFFFLLIQSSSLLQGAQVAPCHVGHGWLWTLIPAPLPFCSCCVALVCSSVLSFRMDFPHSVFTSGLLEMAEFKPTGCFLAMGCIDGHRNCSALIQVSFFFSSIFKRILWILDQSSPPKKCILGIRFSPVFLRF